MAASAMGVCACGATVGWGPSFTTGRRRSWRPMLAACKPPESSANPGPFQRLRLSSNSEFRKRERGWGRTAGLPRLSTARPASAESRLGGSGGSGGLSGGGGGGGSGNGGPGGGGDAAKPMPGAALWLWYKDLLDSHPLISKSLTAGLMNSVADLFCQVFVEKLKDVDWARLLSFVSIGVFLSGPGLHFWYGGLARYVTVPGFGGVAIRIALDQLVFTPLGIVTFFVALLTLENRRHMITAKLEKDWWPTLVANWKVWIPFQIVNFGVVPPQFQVGAAGLLGMAWSVFISYQGHN